MSTYLGCWIWSTLESLRPGWEDIALEHQLQCYYSSTVFNSCIYSISSYFWTSIFAWSWSSSSNPSSCCRSNTVFHEEQQDFSVAHLENCKRISRWVNWNSRWRQERFRWSHLARNLMRWNTIQPYKHILRWWKYCKWRWLQGWCNYSN